MRKLLKFAFLLPILFLTFSCSSDDDSSNPSGAYFTIGNKTYDTSLYQPSGGVIQILSGFEGEKQAQLTLAGINGTTEQGVVQFVLNFPSSSNISGNYVEGDVLEEIGVFDSELSSYSIMNTNQEMQHSEGAVGTLKIQNNGGNNFTIEFQVTYDDGTTAHGNLTQNFVVQSI
jgi:hypothetical protein